MSSAHGNEELLAGKDFFDDVDAANAAKRGSRRLPSVRCGEGENAGMRRMPRNEEAGGFRVCAAEKVRMQGCGECRETRKPKLPCVRCGEEKI